MPNFTHDWFTHHIPKWTELLSEYKSRPASFLEIGCYEGRASVWLCENVLTHEESSLICIDNFLEDRFHGNVTIQSRFRENTQPYGEKVTLVIDDSLRALAKLIGEASFDVAYIDGSHYAKDVLQDAVLTFPLVKVGGLMIFDDLTWERQRPVLSRPEIAIKTFSAIYSDRTKIVDVGTQAVFRKTQV